MKSMAAWLQSSAEVLEQRAGIRRQSVSQATRCCGTKRMGSPRKIRVSILCVILHQTAAYGQHVWAIALRSCPVALWKKKGRAATPTMAVPSSADSRGRNARKRLSSYGLVTPCWVRWSQVRYAATSVICQYTRSQASVGLALMPGSTEDNMVELNTHHNLLLNSQLFFLKRSLGYTGTQNVCRLSWLLIPQNLRAISLFKCRL